MPELPEVETVVRSLAPKLTGRRIEQAQFFSHFVVRQNFAQLARHLAGRTVLSVTRHGKFILIELDRGMLTVHLGMTGKLLFEGQRGPYTRALFSLDQGSLLVYDDIRHFGRIEWSESIPDRAAALGPDALAVTLEDFIERLRRRKAPIKPLLLNQSFVRGIGNIYADEALFLARIHPKATAARLTRPRAQRLHSAILAVLHRAIELKGSSISDYVDAEGNRGSFQHLHQVYGRPGQPCVTCGSAVRRIVLGQRGTHYCPKCQRS